MEKKSTLKWYKTKEKPSFEKYYDGSKGGDLLFQARTQCLPINSRTYRWNPNRSKSCIFCKEEETIEHLLMRCPEYKREREIALHLLQEEIPIGTEDETIRTILCLREDGQARPEISKNYLWRIWKIRERKIEQR